MKLNRRNRRTLLVVHVAVSVGWLGLTAALLTLGIVGAASADPATTAAVYRAMRLLTDSLVVPVSLISLVSGVVLALGSQWGLARYRWVYTKLWLTLLTTAASVFALRAAADRAATAVSAGTAVGSTARDLVIGPSVALALYVFMTAISVVKPWGLTRRGRAARVGRREAAVASGAPGVSRGPAVG
jgi:hypothetical protein